MSADVEYCGNCRHGVNFGEDGHLVCQRNPPVPDPAPYVNTDGDRRPGVWPVVTVDDCCGEWAAAVR